MKIDSPKIHGSLIIVSTIIFFPLAILFILIRFAAHAKVNHLRVKDYKIVGHAFMTFYGVILAILLAVMASESDFGAGDFVLMAIVFGVILGAPALIFYLLANSRKNKMQNLYGRYYQLTTSEGVHTVSALAQLTGESESNVKQDISYMIATGRLPGARLNPATGQIAMDGRRSSGSPDAEAAAATERPAGRPPVAVTCFGCGASSQIVPGVQAECEFCGNALSASGR
ncbi:hypothetical protein B1A99_19735 [Cohnella sp. CIP 111063]|uniref:hypothetical protein n=1 Tax=unclassified Cohnella TaxID=2636738 RepID=UPI000B8BDA5B|nr:MULTISPECIES: hypothetical protein [unclassified Cohnella]OXS56561.1 hypothetical protein B1A99_19735 [Cohnella sp. CIP 111063]PRX68742.1 hypothetical protein B0G52_11372 [Cohnella sp. SGD-V74]